MVKGQGRREPCEALLVDCDGVLRIWDGERASRVEQQYGLPAGVLAATTFEWRRMHPAITGAITHAEWMAQVVDALAASTGDSERAAAAVAEWQQHRGEVNPDVLAFVRKVRASGIPVALATNATDQLAADLEALGLHGEVDVVVNSSEVGHHKPSRDYFAAACAAVNTPPSRCLLLDDDDWCCRGARAAGLVAFRYSGPDDLTYLAHALASTVSR